MATQHTSQEKTPASDVAEKPESTAHQSKQSGKNSTPGWVEQLFATERCYVLGYN